MMTFFFVSAPSKPFRVSKAATFMAATADPRFRSAAPSHLLGNASDRFTMVSSFRCTVFLTAAAKAAADHVCGSPLLVPLGLLDQLADHDVKDGAAWLSNSRRFTKSMI